MHSGGTPAFRLCSCCCLFSVVVCSCRHPERVFRARRTPMNSRMPQPSTPFSHSRVPHSSRPYRDEWVSSAARPPSSEPTITPNSSPASARPYPPPPEPCRPARAETHSPPQSPPQPYPPDAPAGCPIHRSTIAMSGYRAQLDRLLPNPPSPQILHQLRRVRIHFHPNLAPQRAQKPTHRLHRPLRRNRRMQQSHRPRFFNISPRKT